MKRHALLVFAVSLLAASMVSCERVTEGPPMDPELYTELTDIPAEYGALVSVTEVATYPGWFQLWFEDSEGTIRMVRIEVVEDLIKKQVEVIPRSRPAVEEVVEDEG